MSAPSLAWKAVDFLLTGLREDLGQPVRLRRLLAAQSSLAVSLPAPPLSVAAGSIVQWHEWGPRVKWPRNEGARLTTIGKSGERQ